MLKIDDNRWRGLAPYPLHEEKEGRSFYKKDDIKYFNGREKEIEELKKAIRDNSFTTIYGVSGAGKTSLINAGMIPELKKNYLTVPVRLDHRTSIGYNTQIINAIVKEVKVVGGEVESWSKIAQDDLEEDERLWHFLFSSRIWSKTNYQLIPVIFIDQFEEIFTLNEESERIVRFFETINSLQYNMPPEHILSMLEQENRYVDFNDVAQFRMVFIMREDFLARLEDYSVDIPALRRNRRGIKRMNGHQALDVITKPYPGIVNREVAIQILGKVVGKEISDKEYTLDRLSVDTSILSLFCSELYRKAAESRAEVITEELVGQFGDDIITSFYEKAMERFPKTWEYLEAHLLTYSGFRNSMAMEDMIQNGIEQKDLDLLAERRLIRIEEKDGTKRVEFMHDVLCKVAKDHRDGKKAKKDIEKKVNRENRIKFQFLSSILVGLVVLFICLTIKERFNSFGLRPFLFVIFLSISLFGIYKLLFEKKMCNRLSLRYAVSGIIAFIIIIIGRVFDVPIDFAKPSQSSFIGLILYFFPFYICLFVSYLLEESNKTRDTLIGIFKSMAFILLIIPLFCFQIQKYAMAIIIFLFALFVLNPYRFTKEKNIWWITALEGLMISVSIVFIVVDKNINVLNPGSDYLNSLKAIFIITGIILFLTIMMTVISNLLYYNNKERTPKEAWNYCLSFGPYSEREYFKKTFAVIVLLFAIIGSIVFGEKHVIQYTMSGILFFAPVSCATIMYLFFGTLKPYCKITYSHIICILCLIVISVSLCFISQNINNWLIWVVVIAWALSLFFMLKDVQTQESFKYEKLPIVVMWFVAFLCIPILCSYGIEDILTKCLEFLKHYDPPTQQSFSMVYEMIK